MRLQYFLDFHMRRLPDDIKLKFFRFLNGEESVREFEQWVYVTNALEDSLGDAYFDLISLDFAKQDSQYELAKLLERHIDRGECATWKLRKLLNLFLSQEGDLPLLLSEFYELYCDGFYFLDALGLGYGLAIKSPQEYRSGVWQKLTDEEKTRLLNALLPDAIDEAQKVLSWLDEGKIVITDEQDELGRSLYIDTRTKKEKDPNWKRLQTSNDRTGAWWKFWQ